MSFVQRVFRTVFVAVIFLAFVQASAWAQWAPVSEPANNGIKPGTIITMQNWQQYKQFMTVGMQKFFEGVWHWKFPPDVQLEIEATQNYPAGSKQYIEDTEKYGSQVQIVNLPDGRHVLKNYVAGLPFPTPSGPMKGWELLADDWYAYQPYVNCSCPIINHMEDRFNNVTEQDNNWIERRLAHISDPGQPINDPREPLYEYTVFGETLRPEEARYTTLLDVYYRDLSKGQDLYVFVPALRRALRLSTTARCAPANGLDFTYDDTRHGAFNGLITIFDGTFLRSQKVLEGPEVNFKAELNMNNYYMPLMWAKPIVNKWQVRDVWVTDVHRIPSMAAGYCYKSRVLYIDKQVYQAMWADLYDANGKYWKVDYDPQAMINVPKVGRIWTNAGWGAIYDVQNEHMSEAWFQQHANQECKNINGRDYTQLGLYSDPKGLSQIMR